MEERENEPGIRRTDLYNIHFYEKLPFYGSFQGMHYRIAGVDAPDWQDAASSGPADSARQLAVTTWPGPYNYETTDDSLKETAWFAFSNEGLDAVTNYLNQYYQEHYV